jgi:hypothetical protein
MGKNSVTSSEIEPTTFQLVAQRLNHYAASYSTFVVILDKNKSKVEVIIADNFALFSQ